MWYGFYIKIEDEFDRIELKPVGDDWVKSWSYFKKVLYAFRLAQGDNRLDEEIDKYSIDELKQFHNCMTYDNYFKVNIYDTTISRNKEAVEIFNKIVDKICG